MPSRFVAYCFVFASIVGLLPVCWAADLEAKLEFPGVRENGVYLFCRLSVTNPNPNRVKYNIDIEGVARAQNLVLKDENLQGGETRVHNIPVPFMTYPRVSIVQAGRMGSAIPGNVTKRLFLNICELESWASEKTLETFTNAYNSSGLPITYSPSGPGRVDSIVSQLEPVDLPQNWLCYSPFVAVMCKQISFNKLQPEEKAALIKWVDLGGTLVVYEADKQTVETSMLGKIIYMAGKALEQSAGDWPVEYRQNEVQWQSTYGSGNMSSFPFDERDKTGRVGAVIITGLFLLVAGPANYLYCRRKNNIRMLMVTLPGISMAFCLFMIVYFVGTQGFARKGGSYAITVLDESKDRALAFTRHSLFSGLYPMGGFNFDPEAAFLPSRKESDYSAEITKNFHLQSGIFKPTTIFQYSTVLPYTTRERLIIGEDGTVVNGFEKRIESLLIRRGNSYFTASEIEPGKKTRLIPTEVLKNTNSEDLGSALLNTFSSKQLPEKESAFVVAMGFPFQQFAGKGDVYLAKMSQRNEALNPGVKMDSNRVRNIIMGRLEPTR